MVGNNEDLSYQHDGLTQEQAKARLGIYGPNVLEEKKKKPIWRRILEQLSDPTVIVLIVASVIAGLLGELVDTFIILAVVLINTVIGLVQENKAEQAIAALKKMSAQTARVVRDGRTQIIPSEELVPGDTVVLEAGDLVPADLILMESSSLKIEEASLTGESVPAEKDARAQVAEDAPLGDQLARAYYGTNVTYGRGRGMVRATGMKTEMGKIAGIINAEEDQTTPLQKKLVEIGKTLTFIVIGICLMIFVIGLVRGGITLDNIVHSFMVSVSLAVAAVPEGLPAVVTIVMALGVTRMAARKAIVKRLPAVETLGCAQIICSDKTGTLTQNKMNVREVYTGGEILSAEAYTPASSFDPLAAALYLCNDSEVTAHGEIGDPTETALKRFIVQKDGDAVYGGMERLSDLPFDSDRKMMSTVNRTPMGELVLTKGAPDELLKRCTSIYMGGEVLPLDETHRNGILRANHEMADKALRVLGAAFKPYKDGEELEAGLTFVGLTGMIDPPRPEVFEAVRRCRGAGITPVMITGDHKDTAVAIAREIGILDDPSQAIFGNEMDSMDDAQLDQRLGDIRVYARVAPEHKVRIVKAWQRRGKVVAMTGDGVNDAPALKAADIGIGMGITGTDVTKGVSDVLLSDDNFATIVSAVEEGRKIYNNIRKAVQFLLSSNMSEVMSLLVGTLVLPAGTGLLEPVHILWINLVTDSLPAIGLGLDQAEPGLMNDPPRDSGRSFFADGLGIAVFYQGALMALLVLASYFIGAQASAAIGTTMAFITLSTVQLFHSFNMKAGRGTVFSGRSLNNRFLLFAAVLPLVLSVFIVMVPGINTAFSLVPLTLTQWLIAFGLSAAIVPLVEVLKAIKRMVKR